MLREQINSIYARTPVLLWPWIWVQLLVILSRMQAAALRGEDVAVLIGISKWGRLVVLYQSDNLSGLINDKPICEPGKVTFASVCAPLCAIWTPLDTTNFTLIAANDTQETSFDRTSEYAEALRAVP